jgi:hypothetical protein
MHATWRLLLNVIIVAISVEDSTTTRIKPFMLIIFINKNISSFIAVPFYEQKI